MRGVSTYLPSTRGVDPESRARAAVAIAAPRSPTPNMLTLSFASRATTIWRQSGARCSGSPRERVLECESVCGIAVLVVRRSRHIHPPGPDEEEKRKWQRISADLESVALAPWRWLRKGTLVVPEASHRVPDVERCCSIDRQCTLLVTTWYCQEHVFVHE